VASTSSPNTSAPQGQHQAERHLAAARQQPFDKTAAMTLDAYTYVFVIGTFFAGLDAYVRPGRLLSTPETLFPAEQR